MKNKDLAISEDLDFSYLLGLLPPLHDVPQFAWLPELFSIIGYERLIVLCNYAGGETIRIPTVKELSESVDALQWFYDINIKKSHTITDLPIRLANLYSKICEVYNVRISEDFS